MKILSAKFPGKRFYYFSCGKSSIYYILKSFDFHNEKVIIPYYICNSVIQAIKDSGNIAVLSDIDPEDLNISYNSVKEIIKKQKVKAVIVPSLYGNPANIQELEIFLKDKNIKLIDDAAQGYGAKLNNRYISSFGDAGFISISPGKPLAGYRGSIFWTTGEKIISLKASRTASIIGYISYLNFILTRRKFNYNYIYPYRYFVRLFQNISFFPFRNIPYYKNQLSNFDLKHISGLLVSENDGIYLYRKDYWLYFYNLFSDQMNFKILKAIRGEPIFYKIVLLFNSAEKAIHFKSYLRKNLISFFEGYDNWWHEYKSAEKINWLNYPLILIRR